MYEENLSLQDVVDIQHLLEVQRKLSDLVKISVVTTDVDGHPITDLHNFSPFCQLIRSTEKGRKECESCDKIAEKIAFNEKQSIIYDCHLGLKDCCVPIIVGDKLIGAVLGGQVLIDDKKKEDLFDIPNLSKKYDIPQKDLQDAIRKIFVVDHIYLERCVDLYETIANYSKEMGLKFIAQQKLLSQGKERLEYERRAKYAELKTLEAQINPHFLFNTLNSIARMSLFEGAPNTEEMIYNLSDLLRYNLRQTEEFPTLEKEVDNLYRYLALQQIRYQDRLSYQITIEDSAKVALIPMMILQPLVENAIIHGIEPLMNGGHLMISVYELASQIHIRICDTGIGIPPEKVQKLLNKDLNDASGLGLINSHLRLKDAFGPDFGIKIYSNQNFNTIVEIICPKVTDKYTLKKGG